MAHDSLPVRGTGEPVQEPGEPVQEPEEPARGAGEPAPAAAAAGRTAWGRHLQTPLRQFLRTETGSAAVLLAATITALIWANVDVGSYESLWRTEVSLHVGGFGVSQDLHGWL